MPALAVAALLVAILVIVIALEEHSGARRRALGELSPLERLEAAGQAAGSGAPR
jgi:hypothetical protein